MYFAQRTNPSISKTTLPTTVNIPKNPGPIPETGTFGVGTPVGVASAIN